MVLLQTWQLFLKWFWNPDVWLPPGIDWKDIIPNPKTNYSNPEDLIYPIPFALAMICVRIVVERLVFNPMGQSLGLRKVHRLVVSLQPNEVLEKAYKSTRTKLTYKELESLAKRVDMEVRQVERWMRKRTVKDKPTTLAKFSESGWRFLCYTISLAVGTYILWDKAWFWDINYCWYDYPHHSIPNDVWWYYMLGSSFYWSLMFSQFFDVKRKDFWQMFLHHLTTISLLGFSWTCNLTRIGTLVLLLHDCADAFLEAAKMSKYANFDKLGDVVFGLFAILWIVTRLGIFPVYILNSTLIEAPKIVPMFPAYYIFNGMLSILLCLHVFWTYFICKVAFKALSSGKIEDARSSTESASDDYDSDKSRELSNHNNHQYQRAKEEEIENELQLIKRAKATK